MRNGVVVAMAVAVTLLTGCGGSSPAPPAPPTEAEREAVVERYFDARWAVIEDQNPGFVRPVVRRRALVSIDWSAIVGQCEAELAAERYYPDIPAVARLVCEERFTRADLYDSVRSDAQLEYLYDYYTEFVTPCLAMLGFPLQPVPTRESFVGSGGYAWNVYQGNRSTTTHEKLWILARCPRPVLG